MPELRRMLRAFFALLVSIWLVAPALAQTEQEGQMRLYIQQLEERVRQLTGQNQDLAHQVNELRAQLGMAALPEGPEQTGAVTPAPGGDATGATVGSADSQLGAPPRDLGTLTVAPNGEAAPAAESSANNSGAPIDLSTLAGGSPSPLAVPGVSESAPAGQNSGAPETQTAVVAPPSVPAATTALSGSPRDEYDLAYGYILTGDYGLAEQNFKAWLAAFPSDPQVPDAEFWLGESLFQQGQYRDAASAFLTVYKEAPDSSKGPDALLKLGISLAALGEKPTACATFTELGRRYPRASESVMSRVRDEQHRTGCPG
jgi:tol-pal system protein YbgF